MRIHVVAFATAAEALGSPEIEWELDPGATVEALRTSLVASHPSLEAIWPRLAIAIDGELVGPQAPLAEGNEVALLPPVSGGSGA